jgi:hypothetical protein
MQKKDLTIVLILSLIAIGISAASLRARETTAVLGDGTRIEADSASHAMRFYIDGQEKMRLDADGLHVREDIRYGKQLIDYGAAGFDEHVGDGGANAK